MTVLTNAADAGGGPTLPLARGLRVYIEGIEPGALDGFAEVASTPSDADVAVLRLRTPWEPSGRGGMADMFHGGSLAFPAAEEGRIVEICQAVPTVVEPASGGHFAAMEAPAVFTTTDVRSFFEEMQQ